MICLKIKKIIRLLRPGAIRLVMAMIAISSGACQRHNGNPANETSMESPAGQYSPTPATPFERDLQFVRNGQFAHVWIFSRKDKKPLDKDDSDFLRKNASAIVDWVVTDEGKKVIAGSNFDIEPANMEALKKRFVVEDYSGK
jgi:hypothetical protein